MVIALTFVAGVAATVGCSRTPTTTSRVGSHALPVSLSDCDIGLCLPFPLPVIRSELGLTAAGLRGEDYARVEYALLKGFLSVP